MLVSRTQSTTVAKGSALKCCLDTFALSSAPFFASTVYEFSTGLGRFWQCGPVNFPSTCVLLLPPPVTWGWEFRDCNHHLSPAVTSLVGSPLCVLNQCCFCWRESFNVSTFLGEQLIACSLRAHCLTRMSSSNFDALRKASLAADLPQKKHVSVE